MLRFLFAAVLLSVLVNHANAIPANYTVCGSPFSPVGEVVEVDVSPCPSDGNGGCILYKSTSVTIGIKFKPNTASETLTHKVYGVFLGFSARYTGLGSTDACSKVSPACPLVENNEYHYSNTFNVLTTYPKIPLNVRWHLITPTNVQQICILIPVKIEVLATT